MLDEALFEGCENVYSNSSASSGDAMSKVAAFSDLSERHIEVGSQKCFLAKV